MDALIAYDGSSLLRINVYFVRDGYVAGEEYSEVHHSVSPDLAAEIIRTNGIRLAKDQHESLDMRNFGIRTCDWQILERSARRVVDNYNIGL